MRIAHLTAGAGPRYCGACLRDSALVRALRELGHEVVLHPLYLPIHDEEGPATNEPIRMGGIETWLAFNAPALSRVLGPLRGALGGRALLTLAARIGEMTDPTALGPMTSATIEADSRAMRGVLERVARHVAQGSPEVVLLSNALLLGFVPHLRAVTSAPILCTLQSEVDFVDDLQAPWPERVWRGLSNLAVHADGFIAVSASHGEEMKRRLGLEASRLRVVANGIDPSGYASLDTADRHRRILYLARMDERHGAHRLLEAFARLPKDGSDLTLRVAGSVTTADRTYLARLRALVDELGVHERVSFHPNCSLDEKRELLGSSGVLCVPTETEAAGRYVLEAWASGCAVLAPRVGSLVEVLEDTGGGLLYEGGDSDGLVGALSELVSNQELVRDLAEKGGAALRGRYGSAEMAHEMLKAVGELMASAQNEAATSAGASEAG